MEFDEQNSKLVIMFISVNLVAALFGFGAVILFGALAGLMVFTLLVIFLPVLLQYLYLKKRS